MYSPHFAAPFSPDAVSVGTRECTEVHDFVTDVYPVLFLNNTTSPDTVSDLFYNIRVCSTSQHIRSTSQHSTAPIAVSVSAQ